MTDQELQLWGGNSWVRTTREHSIIKPTNWDKNRQGSLENLYQSSSTRPVYCMFVRGASGLEREIAKLRETWSFCMLKHRRVICKQLYMHAQSRYTLKILFWNTTAMQECNKACTEHQFNHLTLCKTFSIAIFKTYYQIMMQLHIKSCWLLQSNSKYDGIADITAKLCSVWSCSEQQHSGVSHSGVSWGMWAAEDTAVGNKTILQGGKTQDLAAGKSL